MLRAGVLRTPVRMHNETRTGIALHDSHLQGCAHQRCGHLGGHRPANNLAGMQVQHGRQIQPAAVRAKVSLTLNLGDAPILVAALLRAVMVTTTNKLTYGKNIPSLPLTAVQTGIVGLGCMMPGIAVLPGGLPPLPNDPSFWYATGFLIVFCTLFAFFAQNYALQRSSPTRVSLLMGTEPVFGALFAVYWLNESLTVAGWLGGLMMVAASLWAMLKKKAKGRPPHEFGGRQGTQ